MKSLIAISTALLICAPSAAHHGPYKNEDGKVHELHIVAGTVKPTGGTRHYSIYSRGEEQLIYQKPGGGYKDPPPYPIINTNNIISYGLSNSETSSDFNAVNAAVVTLAVPIMLPFALLSSGRTIQTNTYIIAVLNETGRASVKRLMLSPESIEHLDNYLSVVTDLEPGEARTESELNRMRSRLLEKAIDKLKYATNKIMVPDNKKPWCLILNLNENDPDTEEFREAERKVAEISKAMGKESVQVTTSSFSESVFDRYLESAPHLKLWAEANHAAAEKLKSCTQA